MVIYFTSFDVIKREVYTDEVCMCVYIYIYIDIRFSHPLSHVGFQIYRCVRRKMAAGTEKDYFRIMSYGLPIELFC